MSICVDEYMKIYLPFPQMTSGNMWASGSCLRGRILAWMKRRRKIQLVKTQGQQGVLSPGYLRRNKQCPKKTGGGQLKQLVTRMRLLCRGGDLQWLVRHEVGRKGSKAKRDVREESWGLSMGPKHTVLGVEKRYTDLRRVQRGSLGWHLPQAAGGCREPMEGSFVMSFVTGLGQTKYLIN